MCGKAAKICLTGKQHLELNKIKGFTVCSQRLIQRATINLLAFEGMLNVQISLLVGIGRHQVGLWRRRWQQSFEALVAIEQNETHAQFRRTVEDAMRPGQPERIEFEYKRHRRDCQRYTWQKGPTRDSQVRRDPARILIRPKPPCQLRLYSQALFMAKSNRDHFRDHHAAGN